MAIKFIPPTAWENQLKEGVEYIYKEDRRTFRIFIVENQCDHRWIGFRAWSEEFGQFSFGFVRRVGNTNNEIYKIV